VAVAADPDAAARRFFPMLGDSREKLSNTVGGFGDAA